MRVSYWQRFQSRRSPIDGERNARQARLRAAEFLELLKQSPPPQLALPVIVSKTGDQFEVWTWYPIRPGRSKHILICLERLGIEAFSSLLMAKFGRHIFQLRRRSGAEASLTGRTRACLNTVFAFGRSRAWDNPPARSVWPAFGRSRTWD